MLKIALVRARYSASGGAERFVHLALRVLAARGDEITLIARSWSSENALPLSVRWLRCDPYYMGSIWRDVSFARAVRRLLDRQRFDLVQSHERMVGVEIYRAGDGVHAAWLARRRPFLSRWARCGVWLNLHHRYLLMVERKMFEHRQLRAVICNSAMVRDEIAARFRISRDKLHVIYNGVDLDYFGPELNGEQRQRLRQALGVSDQQPVLLFMGSGFARKGLATALRALALYGPELTLVVVGRDKRAAHYKRLAAELGLAARCHFVGVVDDPRPYYWMADALVLPTLYDPFPNVALEALACGLPVFASDGCGAREIIVAGRNGWIAAVGDAGALAAQLAQWMVLWRTAEGRAAMQRAARETAQQFSVSIMADRLLALYHDLKPVAEHRPRQC